MHHSVTLCVHFPSCLLILHYAPLRQSTSITDADAEQVYGMILQNRRVTVDEVAYQLQIICGSAYEIIHNRLASHKSGRDGSKINSQNCTNRSSACPLTAAHTVETLKKINFEVLEHPV
jgi:hypothetical protein